MYNICIFSLRKEGKRRLSRFALAKLQPSLASKSVGSLAKSCATAAPTLGEPGLPLSSITSKRGNHMAKAQNFERKHSCQ